jgi:aminoglycoside 3-N-acetyltransferase
MSAREWVKSSDILKALRSAGIKPGDNIVVHSSLRSLGYVEGGAEAVIRALREAISPGGTLMMPTFTFSLAIWKMPPFERDLSPSRVGKITEVFRLTPGTLRSEHPTHSVAASGPLAAELIAGHLDSTPLGRGSPFDKLRLRGGTILMLGTRQDTNSSLHLCEVLADVPYIHIAFTPGRDYEFAQVRERSGRIREIKLYELPGCSHAFVRAEDYLRERGALRDVEICGAASQILDMQALAEALIEKLKQEPTTLLCDNPQCICARRRIFMLSRARGSFQNER